MHCWSGSTKLCPHSVERDADDGHHCTHCPGDQLSAHACGHVGLPRAGAAELSRAGAAELAFAIGPHSDSSSDLFLALTSRLSWRVQRFAPPGTFLPASQASHKKRSHMERTIGGKLAAWAGESAAYSRAIMWHLLVGFVSERAANDLLCVFNSHSCRSITATSPSMMRLDKIAIPSKPSKFCWVIRFTKRTIKPKK